MEEKNQIKEDNITLIIDKPDYDENSGTAYKPIEVSCKIVVIKKGKSITITGSENTIIIPNNVTIAGLTVHGDLNSIINFNNKIIINVIGGMNKISYLAKTNKAYMALTVQGNYNLITNDGTPMISTIIGYENEYRGMRGDRLIFVNRDYKTEGEDIKVKEVVIDKDYVPHMYYRFRDF